MGHKNDYLCKMKNSRANNGKMIPYTAPAWTA